MEHEFIDNFAADALQLPFRGALFFNDVIPRAGKCDLRVLIERGVQNRFDNHHERLKFLVLKIFIQSHVVTHVKTLENFLEDNHAFFPASTLNQLHSVVFKEGEDLWNQSLELIPLRIHCEFIPAYQELDW